MRGRRLRLLLVAALIGTASPLAVGASPACAGEGPRAALVVDTGDSVQTFCVALPAPEVSGLELIELASEQHGLSYKFGFGGEAVCMLAGVGPTGDDCFEDYPDFWGYWRGDGNGGWSWSGSGAGSTTVGDGDVEGWSWGSGSNGDTHPRPPATTFGDVCAAEATQQPPPAKKPRSRGDREPAPSGSGASAGSDVRPPGRFAPVPTAAAPGVRPDRKAREKLPQGKEHDSRKKRDSRTGRGDGRDAAVAGSQSPSPTALDEETAGALEPAASSGPPAAGLAAVGAAALLGGAGFVITRRRRSASRP